MEPPRKGYSLRSKEATYDHYDTDSLWQVRGFTLPIVDNLLRHKNSCALLIYPTKAVTNDQLASISMLLRQAGLGNTWAGKYDGSTPVGERKLIRQSGQVVLTNPDMLHIGILSNHEQWRRFFSRLSLVVIDEAHEYRGIFGSNVALLLRRVRQIANAYGANPTFVAASATATNAKEHASNLANIPFAMVGPDDDGSQRGPKTYHLVRAAPGRALDSGTRLAISLVQAGLSVIVFCPSRTSAEKHFYALAKNYPSLANKLAVYRAGLHVSERERIEVGLKDGSIRGVFSTSALELGVHIGELNVCILLGFPPTMMSMWQRSGRVGRAGKEGVVVVVGSEGLVDNYFLNHPTDFFERQNEKLAINLKNDRILRDHLACALKEMDGSSDHFQRSVLGDELFDLAQVHKRESLDHYLLYADSPHGSVNIRNVNDAQYSLTLENESLGEISGRQILREAYEGAIYYHGGKRYRVRRIINGERKLILQKEESLNETRPNFNVQVQCNDPHRRREWPNIVATYGKLTVTQSVSAYREIGPQGHLVEEKSTSRREVKFPTLGFWLDLKPSFVEGMLRDMDVASLDAALHGLEHLLAGLMPVISPCDSNDYDSKSQFDSKRSGRLFIYDNVYGGIGLASEAFDSLEVLMRNALELVEGCVCKSEEGCPLCVLSARCLDSRKVNRLQTMKLLERITAAESFHQSRVQNLLDSAESKHPSSDEDFEEVRSNFGSFGRGSVVIHTKFGAGRVVGSEPKLTSVAITIDFASGRKSIMVTPNLSLVDGREIVVCKHCGAERPSIAVKCGRCSESL